MADNPNSAVGAICFRVPAELRLQVEATCLAVGATLSEWYRALTIQALGGQIGFDDGYRQGRNLALDLTRRLILDRLSALPNSYEEALALLNIDISNHRDQNGGEG